MGVVLGFLAQCIRQPREAVHAHSHRQVLALDVAGRNVLRVRIASAATRPCSLDLRRAVAAGR